MASCAPQEFSYTRTIMQQFFNNRYMRLAALWLGLATLLYLVEWVIFLTVGMTDFPQLFQVGLALMVSGVLVSRVFSGRIF